MWLIDVSCCRLVGCDLVHLLCHGMHLPAAKVYVTGLWVGGLPLLGIPIAELLMSSKCSVVCGKKGVKLLSVVCADQGVELGCFSLMIPSLWKVQSSGLYTIGCDHSALLLSNCVWLLLANGVLCAACLCRPHILAYPFLNI
jgi:hypothetical protein